MKQILIIALLFTITACDNENSNPDLTVEIDNGRFVNESKYIHEIFSTQEECDAAQPPGFFFNCQQFITFLPNGEATAMFTDILFRATYAINGELIIVNIEQTGGEYMYILSDNNTQMTEKNTSLQWFFSQ